MPKIHDNQLILPGEDVLDAFAASLMDEPELEPVYQLASLREQYNGEYETALRLQAQAKDAEAAALQLDSAKKIAEKAHEALGDKVRANEKRAFDVFMNAKGIEDLRAIHGVRTGKVVRAKAIEWLMTTDYRLWLEDLGELQKQLDTYPKKIEKAVKLATKRGSEAQKQFKKAGDVLLEIRKLENELND